MDRFKDHMFDGENKQRPELTQFCIDNAADAIFWIDNCARFFYVNKAAVDHLGYSRDELLEMSVHQIDPKFSVEKWQEHWQWVKGLGKVSIESVHMHRNGDHIPVEIKVSYLCLDETEFHCAFVRNISERKKAEKVLLESETRLRKTLDVTSDGVWDRDLETGEVYYGSKWASSLGYNDEDLFTGKISWEKLLHPDDREKTLQALRDHMAGKTTDYEAEYRLRNGSNRWQWIHARGKVIENREDGAPLRFVGTHTDITTRKNLEQTLLETSEETKVFAYSVIHDLKNPALAIRGLAERFRTKLKDLPEDKIIMYCDRIIDSSEQVVDLVEKINSYISAKESVFSFEDMPLKDIVQASKHEFAAQLQYRSITWSHFQEHPVVCADRLSLLRVLRNLVENSLKYGGPNLSKIIIGYQNTPGFHVISVKDDGVGMNVENSQSIFQPFKRQSISSGQGGSGLGLAIVKEIAHHHKGEVWVERNRKKGVTFYFAISKNI